MPQTHHLDKDAVVYRWDRDAPPALTIEPGESRCSVCGLTRSSHVSHDIADQYAGLLDTCPYPRLC